MINCSDDFNNFNGRVWLNCAHQGPLPKPAVEAALHALELKKTPHKINCNEFFQVPERLKKSLANLISSKADEIALGNSATYGIQILIQGIPWKSGDEVLVVEGDFPASIVPWQILKKKGVKINFINPQGPFLTPEDVNKSITKKTRLLCATWVSSYTGWILNPGEIGQITSEKGIICIINVSQGLGSLPMDVTQLQVDAITSCGAKWLLGPYGTGFAWLSPALLDQLEEYQAYWLAMQDPTTPTPELDYNIKKLSGAHSYDVFATANFFNFLTWQASLEYLLSKDLKVISMYNQQLVSQLVHGLETMGFRIISPLTEKNRSALVVFSHPEDQKNKQMYNYLYQNGFDLSFRAGLLRASPHLYNTESQIDGLLNLLKAF